MRYTTRIPSTSVLATLLAAGLAAACDAPTAAAPPARDDAGEMRVEATNASVAARLADALATIDLASGAAVIFLDLGDGGVGIAERAPRRARFVALPMVERLDATPLEVYLALAPRGDAAPDVLLRDHRARVARAGAPGRAPRTLAPAQAVAADVSDPGWGTHACASAGTWIPEWQDAFAGITTYREATFRHWVAGTFTFYPGAGVYRGTNTNAKTYLGACARDDDDALGFAVDRRIDGAWVTVFSTLVGNEMKYTFYSGTAAAYRGRVYPGQGAPSIFAVGVGAAWTVSPAGGFAP